MPPSSPLPSRGLPVAPGKVETELARLWEQMGATTTRASLLNLAIYGEEPGSLDANTRLIAGLSRDHACRAIVIAVDPLFPSHGVQAWITAHCHLGRAGAKQVCSEQISFLVPAARATVVGNILLAHLDSDLPLALWWQADVAKLPASGLLPHVDRLLFDSGRLARPEDKMRALLAALPPKGPSLGDLAWTALEPWREAVAELFGHPDVQSLAPSIGRVEISLPRAAFRARLLAAWLRPRLAQLGAANPHFETAPTAATRCAFLGDGFQLEIEGAGPDLLARHRRSDRTVWERRITTCSDDPPALARAELDRAPEDAAYRETLRALLEG